MIAKHARKKIKKDSGVKDRKKISWNGFSVDVGEEIKNVLFAKGKVSFT